MSISRSEEGFTDRVAHAASNLEANTNLTSCNSTATYVIMEFSSCVAAMWPETLKPHPQTSLKDVKAFA